jgi:hypothetical protein
MYMDLVLRAFGLSTIFCLIAILLERPLIILGYTRGRPLIVAILVFAGNFLGMLIGQNIPFYMFELMVLFIGIVAANRFEFIATANKGRWWWKSENQNKNS